MFEVDTGRAGDFVEVSVLCKMEGAKRGIHERCGEWIQAENSAPLH